MSLTRCGSVDMAPGKRQSRTGGGVHRGSGTTVLVPPNSRDVLPNAPLSFHLLLRLEHCPGSVQIAQA